MANAPERKKRRRTPATEVSSYFHSGGFQRLEGRSTAPGSLIKPKSSTLRTFSLIAVEVLFLAIGLWYMFR